MTTKDREMLKKVCRERDVYRHALEVISKIDRHKAAMMGVLAVADCVNVAKQALRDSAERSK